jgi:hypothetical protein
MKTYLGLSYLGSFSAMGVASCCVLPMAMMLLGFGGSWLAVVGAIAGAAYPVLILSTALVAAAWLVARRRGTLRSLKYWLAGSTATTVLAWVLFLNEAGINDYLISRM